MLADLKMFDTIVVEEVENLLDLGKFFVHQCKLNFNINLTAAVL